ncbi:MAG: hypothetical protein M1831_004075 [Alyxoria varia]|nr:MAG: hypothetical protein M1831_004075 [Alyxoria varia]
MASAAVSTHPYTCNTCQVAFRDSELQRGHMQSDWHRYNLKRRVASLPPLTSTIFTEKVLANQATAAADRAKSTFERVCPPCQRTYYSENAYQNHLKSQKHKLKIAQLGGGESSVGVPTEDETVSVMSSTFSLGTKDSVETKKEGEGPKDDAAAEEEFSQVVDGIEKTKVSDEDDPVSRRPTRPRHSANDDKAEHPLSPEKDEKESISSHDTASGPTNPSLTCLFCNASSLDLDANVAHMRLTHGLFIPERTHLVDLKGLIGWLHDRVHALHECLYCGVVRPTASGIQTHMRDKGHCMIAFETEEQIIEIGQFYDFSATYSDDEESDDDKVMEDDDTSSRPRLGAKREERRIDSDENMEDDDGDGEGWETDSSDDTEAKVPNQTRKRHTNKSTTTRPVYHDSEGLHLPSGRVAGHRSLAHYFRQNLHSYQLPEQRAARLALTNGSSVPEDDNPASGSTAPGHAAASGTAIQRIPRGRQPHENAITRANGGLGMQGVSEGKRKEVQRLEFKQEKRAQKAENRYKWGLERRGNFQKHYRASPASSKAVRNWAEMEAGEKWIAFLFSSIHN